MRCLAGARCPATGLNNLALLLQDRGDLAGPEPLYRESLAMRTRLFPNGHVSIATDLNNLARLLRARGDLAGAEPIFREAVAMYERTQGKDYWPTGNARLGLGRTLTGLNRFNEGETVLVEAERVLSTAQGVPKGRHQQSLEALVTLYESWDKAEPGKGRAARAAYWKSKIDVGHPTAAPKN